MTGVIERRPAVRLAVHADDQRGGPQGRGDMADAGAIGDQQGSVAQQHRDRAESRPPGTIYYRTNKQFFYGGCKRRFASRAGEDDGIAVTGAKIAELREMVGRPLAPGAAGAGVDAY